jgi:hypothetical protein
MGWKEGNMAFIISFLNKQFLKIVYLPLIPSFQYSIAPFFPMMKARGKLLTPW